MSNRITLEFPDGERIHTTTNPRLSQYEDYYHNGEWYNINDPRLKDVTVKEHGGDGKCCVTDIPESQSQ